MNIYSEALHLQQIHLIKFVQITYLIAVGHILEKIACIFF